MSIKLEHVSYTYMPGTPFEHKALHDISLEIKKGEFVALIGHTGSGKSTLIQQMNGLLQPTEGKVTLDGVDLKEKGEKSREVRNRAGMVFQYPEHQLFAETVFEDIAFGPKNMGVDGEELQQRVKDAMKFVGLDFETYVNRSPFTLSGGQKRRVAIAGVVAMNPSYLILDEPSAGLDPGSRNSVFFEIMELYKKRKPGIILVTHSMEEAAKYADRLLVIRDGKVMLDGKPADIFLKHEKELKDAGMDIPEVFKLSALLRKHGMKLPNNITDSKTLLREIIQRKGIR